MKILMVAPQPFFEPRGTPFSVRGRLRALSELGHEVDLLTYHVGQDVSIPGVKIFRTPRIGFIKSVKIGPSVPKLFLDSLLFVKTVHKLMTNKYDLLHTHEEASFFGILLAKIFRIPHLYDMHSSPSQQLSNFKVTGFKPLIRLFEWIESRVVNSSNAVITICPALEDYVKEINGHVPHVMIENVASEDGFSAPSQSDVETFIEANPDLKGKKIILYAGTFEAYQGLGLLIDSAPDVVKQYPDTMYLMVGGKPEQVQHYQHRAADLGVSSNFVFTGTRPPEEMPIYVNMCSLLVSPRTGGTNTPLKIYAYLKSGKPIVATDLYTHTQVLDRDVSVLTEPTPAAFASGILSVLQDNLLADRLSSNAQRLFEEKYSFQIFVGKTAQVLQLATG